MQYLPMGTFFWKNPTSQFPVFASITLQYPSFNPSLKQPSSTVIISRFYAFMFITFSPEIAILFTSMMLGTEWLVYLIILTYPVIASLISFQKTVFYYELEVIEFLTSFSFIDFLLVFYSISADFLFTASIILTFSASS